jgi:hypothetical protein
MMTYTTIIAFYFGTQSQKKAGVDDGNKESWFKMDRCITTFIYK